MPGGAADGDGGAPFWSAPFGIVADARIVDAGQPGDGPTGQRAGSRRLASGTQHDMAGIDVELADGRRRHIREDGANAKAFIKSYRFTHESGLRPVRSVGKGGCGQRAAGKGQTGRAGDEGGNSGVSVHGSTPLAKGDEPKMQSN
jgi:hypothetical protein